MRHLRTAAPGVPARSRALRLGTFVATLVSAIATACGGGGGWEDDSYRIGPGDAGAFTPPEDAGWNQRVPERGEDPFPAPTEPGLADDDQDWRCDARPVPPRIGHTEIALVGVTECLANEEAALPGDDIWVSPDGTGGGADRTDPLGGLTDGVCRAKPGQTVHLLPGTYHEGVVAALLGDPDGAPIVIRGEPEEGAPVVISGDGWRTHGIALVESDNVVIERVEVRGFTDSGVYALDGERIVLRAAVVQGNGRCSVDEDAEDEGFGINLLAVEEYVVERSAFVDNGPSRATVLGARALGTAVNTFESSGIVRDNVMYYNRGAGVLVEDGHDTLVENNRIEANWLLLEGDYWDGGIWVDGSVDVELVGNEIRNNHGGGGIEISDEDDGFPARSVRTVVRDNVVEGHFAGVLVWGFEECPPPAEAISDYASLETRNTLRDNTFRGQPRDVWCDPEFIGGEAP